MHERIVDERVELVPAGAEPLEPGSLEGAFQRLRHRLERTFQVTVVAGAADVVEGRQQR